MSQLTPKLLAGEDNRLLFWCPGCERAHVIQHGPGSGPRWTWNGSADRPTFSPSILVRMEQWHPPVTAENLAEYQRAPWPQQKVKAICHSFVTDGQIRFLGDCTHALAGKAVPLPHWDDV